MLIVTIGTVASASTWSFNVARSLLALSRSKSRSNVVSLYAERATDLLSNVPDHASDIVIKAHWADYSMLRLLDLVDTRVILTYRDPKDSVASQLERTRMTFREAVGQLATTFATFAMIADNSHVLILRYEDHFTSNRDTLLLLAQHLGVTVSESTVDTLFRIFQSDNVREEIAKWKRDAKSPDTVTHWDANHVGDGLVGKSQKRLSEAQIRAVSGAFPSYFIDDKWKRLPIYWSSVLFRFADKREPTETETLSFSGREAVLVYGPYLCLPTGRWRILPDIKPTSMADPVTLRLDIHINLPNRGVLKHRTVTLPTTHAEEMVLEFDNTSHSEQIEIRIWSVNDGRCASATFSGVTLNWLGPLERNSLLKARPVTDTDLMLRTAPGLFDVPATTDVDR
jgi:Sulfotransferase domain